MKVSIYDNYKSKFFLISGITLLVSSFISQPAKAGTELPDFCANEVNESLKTRCEELKLKILDEAEAETEENIATSEQSKAEAEIILPEPTEFKEGAKPLTGDIEFLEKSKVQETMESRILAYQAADNIAADICRTIDSKINNNSELIILDDATISAIPSSLILNSRKELYKKTYSDLFMEAEKELQLGKTPKDVGDETKRINFGIGALPGAAARTIIEFSSLFKTEQTIGNADVTLETDAIVSSLGSECKKGKIYHPSVYLLDLTEDTSNLESIWNDLNFLLEDLQKSNRYIFKFTSKGVDNLTADQTRIIAELEEQNNATIALFEELKTVNENNKNALYLMAKANTAYEKLSTNKNAYMLQIKNVKTGGSFNETKNIFSSNIKYTGGSIISYILFDQDSSILSSDTIYYLTPKTKIDSDTPLTNISDSE